jgi:hypothetical protein
MSGAVILDIHDANPVSINLIAQMILHSIGCAMDIDCILIN